MDGSQGKFEGTREFLKSYLVPAWFSDAKFGIWSHWGSPSAVGEGDWYARFMYIEGSTQHEYYLKPLPASGELDPEERQILDGITTWRSVNASGIYGTRPWKVFGEGPAMKAGIFTTRFNADAQPDYTRQDLRFKAKGRTVYVFAQGWPPSGELNVASIATTSAAVPEKALHVRMLGRDEVLKFVQGTAASAFRSPPKGRRRRSPNRPQG